MELKVFYNGSDYVIADSRERAIEIWEHRTREEWDNYSEWKELRPSKRLKGLYRRADESTRNIWIKRSNNAGVTAKVVYGVDLEVESPLSEWIEVYGEGWLMSTEH